MAHVDARSPQSGRGALNLEILTRPLTGPRLVHDYVAGEPALAPFFLGSPFDAGAYRRKAEEVDRRFDARRREALAAALRPTSPGAERKLAEVIRNGGFFVTTGQQAGFLTGPLFTVYKILTAVKLARSLESVVERPVAAIFWVASEDHDWEEARRCTVLDTANRLVDVALDGPDGDSNASMRRRVLDASADAAIARVAELLPPTEFREAVLEVVRRCYRPGQTVSDAFADLVAELFAPFDLLVVDAAHPSVKELGANVVIRELDASAEHEVLVAEQTRRLVEAGYHGQVPVLPGAINLFHEDDGGRDRLERSADGSVSLRRSGKRYTVEEIRALVRTEPARFSPNVLLRPVVESAVFPTLSYVAGPGELSYWAQIGCLFQAHGMEMPIVYPRASVTLVEPKVRKVLDKFGLTVEEFGVPLHELTGRILREGLPEPVRAALQTARDRLNEVYAELEEATSQVDPTLKGPVRSARNASDLQLREVEKKIVQLAKKQREIGLEQLEKAAANLAPRGKPQERVLNVIPYLVRYGPDLLPEIADAIEIRIEAGAGAGGTDWSGVRCGGGGVAVPAVSRRGADLP